MPGYKKPILLKRRSIPNALGMAIYVREGFSASRKRSAECGCHEVQVMKVCGKRQNFYIFSIYRNPTLDDSIFDCLLSSMATIQETDRKATLLFVGDFNAHHNDWFDSGAQINRHGHAAKNFGTNSGCEQLIAKATHIHGNCLDLLFTDSPGIVTADVGGTIGSSDHCFISANIKTNQLIPNVCTSRKIYLKSRADWDAISRDLENADWPAINRHADMVSSLTDTFINIIDRRVPTRILKYRNKDKAWFNDNCRNAYHEKQSAYHLWSNNKSDLCWRNFIRLRAEAQFIYDTAEREYNNSLKETLSSTDQPHKFWSILKSALNGVDSSMPPLLKADGSVEHCPKKKASLLAGIFDRKQSNEHVDLPPTCFPEVNLSSLAFRSSEVKQLLLDLDNYGGMDPNGIFPL
ncbi:MAG: endonuclease/exonuclease/phosphatase family protein, partial [Cyanobacteria bacterium J06553_1]